MDREALVYVDLDGVPHLMGRLWARTHKNKESATFEYDKTWLDNPARFSPDPALQAGRHGLTKAEIDRIASAFEHEDLHLASGRQ